MSLNLDLFHLYTLDKVHSLVHDDASWASWNGLHSFSSDLQDCSWMTCNTMFMNVAEIFLYIYIYIFFSFSLLLFSDILLLEIFVPIFPQRVHWYSLWFISFSLVLSINTALFAVFTVRLTWPYNYQIVFFF